MVVTGPWVSSFAALGLLSSTIKVLASDARAAVELSPERVEKRYAEVGKWRAGGLRRIGVMWAGGNPCRAYVCVWGGWHLQDVCTSSADPSPAHP